MGLDYHWMRTTGPQREFLAHQDDVVLWRGPNAVGKSTALALLAHDTCRGVARFGGRVFKPPCEVLVAGSSWQQMVPLMQKLWELAPREELDPRCAFDPGRGITGKPPRMLYTSGPGKGSIIHFATYEQGAQRIAGFQGVLGICDEPPTAGFYGELRPRILRHGGIIRIGFTPTLTSPPLEWIWEMVDEDKTITELTQELTEEACWLETSPGRLILQGPWKTQQEIDDFEAGCLPPERDMRMGRSRYPAVEGRWITGFDESQHVNDVRPHPSQPYIAFGIGIDYGIAAGKQVASLVAVWQSPEGDGPSVWYLDCEQSDGFSSKEQDAAAVLEMIRRNGLTYDQITDWVGDRAAESRKTGLYKDNADLRAYMAALMNVDKRMTRYIRTPLKSEGSVMSGASLMNSLFLSNRATVSPRAKPLIDAFKQFNGHPKHPTKDAFDSARYIIERMVKRGAWMAGRMPRDREAGLG